MPFPSGLSTCGRMVICSMASIWSKIGRVVFGAGRSDVHAMYFENRHLHLPDFLGDAFRATKVAGGVLREECAALYYGPQDEPPKDEQGNT
jgi:tRNA(adenine34) deaminase